MSILDITTDNFNITVADVAKEVTIQSYCSWSGNRRTMHYREQGTHSKNAKHVEKIICNRILRNVNKIIPGWPTSRQVRDVVEQVLGKKVSCRIQKYTGRDLKNTVSYHINERGDTRAHGCKYSEEYKGTVAEIRICEIFITY